MGLVKSMAKEMMKEIGNKSREFYEFVLPPVDMLDGNILSIQASKQTSEEEDQNIICNQRPSIIDKKIRLPVDVKDDEDTVSSAKYSQGVLSITIPVQKHGKDIKID
jgi:HSP20 family molecular chaperone IbpA